MLLLSSYGTSQNRESDTYCIWEDANAPFQLRISVDTSMILLFSTETGGVWTLPSHEAWDLQKTRICQGLQSLARWGFRPKNRALSSCAKAQTHAWYCFSQRKLAWDGNAKFECHLPMKRLTRNRQTWSVSRVFTMSTRGERRFQTQDVSYLECWPYIHHKRSSTKTPCPDQS